MLTIDTRYAVARSDTVKLIICCTMMLAAGTILWANAAHGATTGGSSSECSYSQQLQNSPYREEYIARLATEIGNYWASNEHSTVASDADEGFSIFTIGSTSSDAGQEGAIDSFSRNCLTCHDGTTASDVSVNYRNAPGGLKRYGHGSGKDHPIGMDYESYASSGSGRYKSISTLDSKMIFIDGKVGCLTCHNPLNPEKNHLVMSDRRSALCLTCHNK